MYDIKLDLRHNKVKSQNPIPRAKIDSLADSLDYHYPRVRNLNQHPDTFKKYSRHTRLKKEFEKDPDKRPGALRVAQKKTLEDFRRGFATSLISKTFKEEDSESRCIRRRKTCEYTLTAEWPTEA